MEYLLLERNEFSGTLPDWSGMSKIKSIHLDVNRLRGTLPAQWSNMSRTIQHIRLFTNELTGSLPPSWHALTVLKTLRLHDNKLTGALPALWGNMSQLDTLDLRKNAFSGLIPLQWGRIVPAASNKCDLSDNTFGCPLPPFASNCGASCSVCGAGAGTDSRNASTSFAKLHQA